MRLRSGLRHRTAAANGVKNRVHAFGSTLGCGRLAYRFNWETKNIEELLDDLEAQFSDDFRPHHEPREVQRYGQYFLGSIVISHKDSSNYIIDG